MTDTSSVVAARRPAGIARRRSALWRWWVLATFVGETAGFLIPALVAALLADRVGDPLRLLALIAGGCGEGAVLGWVQGRVLARVLPGLSVRDWSTRTGLAAGLAWAVGLTPSSWPGLSGRPVVALVALAVPSALVLLLSIGVAQWTVLRRHVTGSAGWIGWTAVGWLVGLLVFLGIATPLWQPAQDPVLVAAIGTLAGGAMALTVAMITGWGLVRLAGWTTVPPAAGPTAALDTGPEPWELPGRQVAAALDVAPDDGIDATVAAARLTRDGPNEVATRRPVTLLHLVLGQLRDTLILVLLAAAALTALIGDFVDFAVILLVIVVNTTLGVVQERRALRAVSALSTLVAPRARVVRANKDSWVPTRELVRGDVLRLAAGDVVGADARLLRSTHLQVDESLLTGESLPTDRAAATTSARSGPVADRPGMVHAGSTVVRGTGEAVVVATGAGSAIGRVATLVRDRRSPDTPLQRRLATLGRQISIGVAVACLIFVASGLLRGQPWEITVIAGVALAVAAVPESLPAVVSLALAAGAARMSRHGAVVRSLPAVETLGSVTLLATDKTGTLTQGAMRGDRTWTGADGERLLGGDPTSGAVPAATRALLEAVALCNDADPTGAGAGGAAGTADTETALVRAARDVGIDVAVLRAAHSRLWEEPFDAAARRMTTGHRTPDGVTTVLVKGAPEVLLPGVADAGPAAEIAQSWAAAGRRVLAVTRDGALLGLLALADPLRPEAAPAIAALHRAGIRPVLVSGDHAGTAEAIAREVGIVDAEHPAAGTVYARIEPVGKLALVTGWQAAGHVVAMTGDGVNDAPALRAADIGVAMGQRGTEVAKEAADLVLADDSLATITAAVAEGRRVFDNVRRFVGYGLAGGAAEVLVMLVGPLLGLTLPLLPAQVLWVNLLTHGPVGVAMGAEPAAPDVLRRPPRAPSAGLVDRALLALIAGIAAALTAACLVVAVWSRALDGPWQTQLFVTLATGQLVIALALRPAGSWRRGRGAPWLPVAVGVNALLLVAAVYLPGLIDLLRTQPLTAGELALSVGAALIPAALVLLTRAAHSRSARTGANR